MTTASAIPSSLSAFQDRFADALLAGDAAAGTLAAQPGFAVYRNTVMKGWVDALEANYPSVRRLVGEPFFRTAAAAYARNNLGGDPRLWCYGERYASFLASYAPAAALPYLPGVAQLDRCWTESHGAASAPALTAGRLAGLAPEALAACRLAPHPAARWAWFEGQPVMSIWRRNREASGVEERQPLAWRSEGALLARPGGAVGWQALDAAGCALMDACAQGQPLGMAAVLAMEADPQADLADLLATLLQAGAFHAIDTGI